MPNLDDECRAAIAAARVEGSGVVERWRAAPAYRAAIEAFAGCPADDPAPARAAAERLLSDGGWAQTLLAPLIDALAANPFFEPPFKVSRDGARIGGVLVDCPAASITASVTRAAALAAAPPPSCIVFSGRVSVTRVIKAGGATMRRWHVPPIDAAFSAAAAPPCTELPPVALFDGQLHCTDGRTEAQLIVRPASDVVTLVATLRAGADPLLREHDVATGALSRVASADDRPSRTEMLLTLLRISGRADAGACFDQVSRDPAFQLRWTAMREWLGLDARSALPRLGEMATGDPHVEVRAAAGTTLRALRPRIEEAACRA